LLLISQPGDQAALAGLYDLLQTLECGAAERRPQPGRPHGPSASAALVDRTVDTTVFAEVKGGLDQGLDADLHPRQRPATRASCERLEASFAADGSRALDPGIAPMTGNPRGPVWPGWRCASRVSAGRAFSSIRQAMS
jgi:hypothetical protein